MAKSITEGSSITGLAEDTPVADAVNTAAEAQAAAKARFAKALEEAKAGALALGKEAIVLSGPYREKLMDKLNAKGEVWLDEAKGLGEQAKDKAASLAGDGKTRASDLLASLGKLVAGNAGLVDDKLGAKYGDVARSAAKHIQDTASSLNSQEFSELGNEALAFVRKRPVVALGLAAAAGYLVARATRPSPKPAPAVSDPAETPEG